MELKRELWPERVKEIKPRVRSIYYKGNIDLLLSDQKRLAVVGSRKMSEQGRKIVEEWIPELVGKGVIIVSGFMYGIDQVAHRACIENGGKTIAVLGWGIDRGVARIDEDLYQRILDRDGLILSEYPGMTPGARWTFPERDRIVAGISDGIWVVEAALKSGSMITARLGKEIGKPVWAIGGMSEGTDDLIESGQAEGVFEAEDMLNFWDS